MKEKYNGGGKMMYTRNEEMENWCLENNINYPLKRRRIGKI